MRHRTGTPTRSRRRTITGVVTVALGVAAAAFGLATPATAAVQTSATLQTAGGTAHPALEVSIGGSAFAPIAKSQLFASGAPLVPGTSRTTSFTVRNASPVTSLLSIALVNANTSDSELLRTLTFRTEADGRSTDTALDDASENACPVIVPDTALASGQQLVVTVTVALMASVTGVDAQQQTADFDFVAGTRSPESDAGPSLCASLGHPGRPVVGTTPPRHSLIPAAIQPLLPGTPLADTGSNVLPYLLLAALLAGTGTVLLLARRRRDRHTEGTPSEGRR